MSGQSKRGFEGSMDYRDAKRARRPGGSRDIEVGSRAIMLTCPRRMEGKVAREMAAALGEIADELYGDGKGEADPTAASGGDTLDFQAALAAELEEARSERAVKRRFRSRPLHRMDGVALLEVVDEDPRVDPVQLVERLLTDARETGVCKCLKVSRVVPLQAITAAHADDIVEAVEPLLEKALEGVTESLQWCVDIRLRHCDTVERNRVNHEIAQLLPPGRHAVNLRAPDLVVFVRAFKNRAGVSVVRHFTALGKYSLRTVLDKLSPAAIKVDKKEAAKPKKEEKAQGEEGEEKAKEGEKTKEGEEKVQSEEGEEKAKEDEKANEGEEKAQE